MLRVTVLAVIGMSALICSARALSKEDETARDVALQWLQVVDSGNYKDATLMMSEAVRATQDWSNYLAARRAPLGRLSKRNIIEIKHASTVPNAADVRNYDIIRFKTSFEHNPAATEEIVMTKMGCCWEVSGYSITQ